MILIPEACLIKNNRFVRPRGGDSVIGTIPDRTPPLDQFRFEPNRYEGNQLIGGRNAFPLATDGWTSEAVPDGWSEASERSKFKILTARDVGPAWVIALRETGKFPMEEDGSTTRTPASPAAARKKPKS